MKQIPLVNGKGIVIVDDDMYDYLMQWKWYRVSNYAARRARVGLKMHTIYMHSLVLLVHGKSEPDHINRNKLDNRRENLRPSTHLQNSINRGKTTKATSSRYKGVSWSKRENKWISYIKINGVLKRIGRFELETDAAKSYDRAAMEHFGSFAAPNFSE